MSTFAQRVMADFRRAGYGSRTVAAAGFTAHVVGTVTGAMAGAIGNAAASEATYAANRFATNHVPDIANAAAAYYAGYLPPWLFFETCANNGVEYSPGAVETDNKWKYAWSQIIKHQVPKLDVSTVVDLYHRHQLTRDEAYRRIGQHGLTRAGDRDLLLRDRGWYDLGTATDLWRQGIIGDVEYQTAIWREGIGENQAVEHLVTQRGTLPLTDWREHWLSGWITDEAYRQRIRREGVTDDAQIGREVLRRSGIPMPQVIADWHSGKATEDETERRFALLGYGRREEWKPIVLADVPFDPQTALSFYYRGEIDGLTLRGALGAAGIQGDRQTQWINGNRPIPAAQDLVSFAVHEVWDNAVVQRFGYDEDFPYELSWFMGRQGWGESELIPAGGGQPAIPPLEWALAYWRAHWRPLSPTQGYEMFHSLTPARVQELRERIPGLIPFTWEDLSATLKIADYPPRVRAWLAATSFTIMDIRQARQVYASGLRNRDWYIEQLTRRGQTPADAAALVELEDFKQKEKREAPFRRMEEAARKQAVTTIVAAYKLGTYTRELALSQLHDFGVEDEVAQALIHLDAAQENLKIVQESLTRLRRGFLAGEFAASELPAQLLSLGIIPEMVPRYVSRWTLARSQTRRMASTGQLQKWVAEGKLPRPLALARLLNLGWTNPDALLLLADAQASADKLHAAAEKADTLAKTKRQRELEKVAAKGKALVSHAQAALRRETSIATLKRWVCEAIVSPKWAGDRMLAMGYAPELVEDYIKDWASQSIDKKGVSKCEPPKEDGPAATPEAQATPEPPPFGGKIIGTQDKIINPEVKIAGQ